MVDRIDEAVYSGSGAGGPGLNLTTKPGTMRYSSQDFLSATKLILHIQDISHGLGGFLLC